MEYPALEEIYDLSTNDLRVLQQTLRNNSEGHDELLEAVALQIQQRKAVQYFSQLCKAENPYAKRAAAFNQQFLKLAAEAIAKNYNTQAEVKQESQVQSLQTNKQLPKKVENNNNLPSQTHINQKPIQFNTLNTKNERISTSNSTKQQNSQRRTFSQIRSTITSYNQPKKPPQQMPTSRITGQIKLNLGWKKGSKDKMKQMMKNILANTKISQDAIIKKNCPINHHNNINQQKKCQSHQSKVQKIQPQCNKNNKKSVQNAAMNSQKIIKSQNKNKQINKKQLLKNNKQQKKQNLKLPKINQYKDLLEMVKQQQQQKKNRLNKQSSNHQKLPQIQPHNENQLQQPLIKQSSRIYSKQQLIHTNNKQPQQPQQSIAKNQIKQIISIKQSPISPKKDITVTSQQHDQIVTSNKPITQQIPSIRSTNNKNTINSQQYQPSNLPQNQSNKHEGRLGKTTSLQQNSIILQKKQPNSQRLINTVITNNTIQTNNVNNTNNNILNPIAKEQQFLVSQPQKIQQINQQKITNKNQMKKLIQSIQKQQQNQFHFFKENQQLNQSKIQIQNNNQQLETQNVQQQIISIENRQQKITKKCYSEQYWQHIREEAQLQIKRFKQQKQYIQKQQQLIPQTILPIQNINDQQDQQQNMQDNQNNQKQQQQQQPFDKEIIQKQEQLNKMKKQFMKKNNVKLIPAVPIPKIIRNKPQFDYFSVFPTFNHIFSVMYLKPTLQALNDIPNIMRDIKTLFTSHIQHMSTKSSFKPAIFLPFDNNSTFQLNNPKQLIAHAQQTYIDLKIMIQRVQIFNNNLHGQFINSNNDMYYRVVKNKQQVYDIITTSFLRTNGWKQLPHGCSLKSSWNLFWSWSKPDIDLNKLLVFQKINHFPFNKNLSRKDLLYKNLDLFRKTFKINMNFLPLTFNLPKQFSQLSAKFHQEQIINKNLNYWIMKPIGKSRGRGIKIVTSLSQLNYTDNIVVQKYIANPMLIDGYKFDMRIYVLVTSFHPLQAFVYRQGFARLSTQKYSLDAHSIKNTFIHLTNFAINRNNTSANSIFSGGSKISLKTLKDKITKMGYSFNNIWTQIHDIIVKSLLGCSVSVPSFPTAFQLFGYDIMVDQLCNCHLIQINSSPSLERSYMIDEIVKQNLIDDILNIIDVPNFDKKQLLDVLTQRINAFTTKKRLTQDDDLIALARILRYKPIRKLGQIPSNIGLFEMIAPCQTSIELQKLIKAKSGANNPMNID